MSEVHGRLARIRPRIGLVILAYAIRSTVALFVAWPLAQRLAPVNVMALPRADRELFAPGAQLLAHTLAEQSAGLMPFWNWRWLWGGALMFASAVSAAVLLQALAHPPGARVTVWLSKARHAWPSVFAITGLEWLTLLLVLALGKALLPFVPAFVYPMFGEKGADVALFALLLVVSTLGVIAFALADIARAASVRWSNGIRAAIAHAWLVFMSRWRLCLAASFGYFAACGVLPTCAECLLPSTATATSLQLVGIAIVHQLIAVALCALHLLWWRLTLAIVRVPQKPNEMTPEDYNGELP